ncbi:SDR family NAD(P)-dependent oxidoreductase [Plantactinospora siamensis]|uniref:SDR family NAD(P)-dependent oxidoreductase n=1 Tax=Plantactinospora siamensis TaxID=555372 RepID=A0ABV6NTM4_9ACTN
MSSLRDRVALVTGSSRGIGAVIAETFAAAGASVVVHGRDAAAAAAVRDRIGEAGGRAVSVTGDVTDPARVAAMRAEAEEVLGPVEILVVNAGGGHRPRPVEDITPQEWRAALEGNLTGPFLTVREFLPGMKARRSGVIITISSSAGRRRSELAPIAYAAAKAGLQLFTQDLAAQVGPYGIRANCVAPETILTERTRALISAEQQRSLIESRPIRRLGTPEDVARAALYLASDDSSWVTGTVLDVAGGSVMV